MRRKLHNAHYLKWNNIGHVVIARWWKVVGTFDKLGHEFEPVIHNLFTFSVCEFDH